MSVNIPDRGSVVLFRNGRRGEVRCCESNPHTQLPIYSFDANADDAWGVHFYNEYSKSTAVAVVLRQIQGHLHKDLIGMIVPERSSAMVERDIHGRRFTVPNIQPEWDHISESGLYEGANTLLYRHCIEVRLIPLNCRTFPFELKSYHFDPALGFSGELRGINLEGHKDFPETLSVRWKFDPDTSAPQRVHFRTHAWIEDAPVVMGLCPGTTMQPSIPLIKREETRSLLLQQAGPLTNIQDQYSKDDRGKRKAPETLHEGVTKKLHMGAGSSGEVNNSQPSKGDLSGSHIVKTHDIRGGPTIASVVPLHLLQGQPTLEQRSLASSQPMAYPPFSFPQSYPPMPCLPFYYPYYPNPHSLWGPLPPHSPQPTSIEHQLPVSLVDRRLPLTSVQPGVQQTGPLQDTREGAQSSVQTPTSTSDKDA